MKITSIETAHYDIPLPEVLTDSTHGEMRYFAVVTVRVRTDDGAAGLGYTYTVGKTGGGAILSLIDRDLSALLLGQDPRRNEQIWEKLWWGAHYVGRGGIASFAISAIDIALWDLKSRLAGEPLWRLLGGHSGRARVYAGGIDLEMSPEQLREQTHRNLDRGYRAIKMKAGRERLADDTARIAAVRDVIGADMPLMVDANMRWTADQAIRAARAFTEYDLTWLEEPVIPDDVDGHVRVLREGGIPVAAGENYRTIYEFQKLIAAGGVSFPEPDLSNIGGITGWMKVAHLAEAHNLPVTTHGVHDLHVHLLAAVPNASLLEAHGFGLEEFILEPVQIREGYVAAPESPGHGIEFDWGRLETHRAV